MSKGRPIHGFGGSGGASLSFKIIPYATEAALLAASPAENIIGVVTTSKITSWIFAADQPSDASEGLLWIKTGTASPVAFNALKKNGITVYPLIAMQYVGGVWTDVTAKSYQGGAWVDWWAGELYDSGDEFTAITGGWLFKGVNNEISGTTYYITKNSDHIQVKAPGSGNLAGASPEKAIDLSSFSTLHVLYIQPQVAPGIYVAKSFPTTEIAAQKEAAKASVQTETTLDISSLDGNYEIIIADRGSTAALKIYKVWLT